MRHVKLLVVVVLACGFFEAGSAAYGGKPQQARISDTRVSAEPVARTDAFWAAWEASWKADMKENSEAWDAFRTDFSAARASDEAFAAADAAIDAFLASDDSDSLADADYEAEYDRLDAVRSERYREIAKSVYENEFGIW